MTALARTWDRLTLPGKALFVLIPVLAILSVGLVVTLVLFGPFLWDLVLANLDIVRFVVAATILLVIFIPIAFIVIYMEMKVIALMNLRIGPERVGPWGTLFSVVHGLKFLLKEDFIPNRADAIVFTWAPVVVFSTAALAALVLPFAPGLYGQDFNLALLYFFAVGGMTVVGLLMGGWASYNKYSLLGGLRSAAQIVSYEIPLTLSVVGLVILAGTMSLNQIVLQQGASGWFTDWFAFRQPLGLLIFFLAATAEANRTPFDMTEADQEIVAGFATEYSGMRFAFFFFAEYVNVFIISAITTVLFLGGWNAPFPVPHFQIDIDPGSLGLGLLFVVGLAPLIGTLLLAAPIYLLRSRTRWWVALIVGFVLFNVLAGGLVFLWAYVSFDWVAGLFWFVGKTFALIFLFVWMRGTLPRIRMDQLMGFAWKWLLPVSLLNLFVTATAVIVIDLMRGTAA